jgi:manganese/zinc/iron transport system substrate-binding protein
MRFSLRYLISICLGATFWAFLALPGVADDRLQVVATTGMISDAATQVGGDLVEVRALMGPGVDPHAYRQTRSDIVAMTKADIVLWHGLYLEAQMEEFLQKLERRKPVVAVAAKLPKDVLLAHEDYSEKYDPHVWMVPGLWEKVVLQVQDALASVDPDNADIYAHNASAHIAQIRRLAVFADEATQSIPAEQRLLLTAHDAFGYFGAAYDIEVLGVQGISTQSEAGLNRISELVDLLVARGVRGVFVESSVSDRNMKALIEGAAAKGHDILIGGELFSDAMGAPGTYEGTYIGMIDHNVTVITSALGGNVPGRGMDGKLSAGF